MGDLIHEDVYSAMRSLLIAIENNVDAIPKDTLHNAQVADALDKYGYRLADEWNEMIDSFHKGEVNDNKGNQDSEKSYTE